MPSATKVREVGSYPTRVDERGGRSPWTSPSMQARKVDYAHTTAISQGDDVTIPSLHRRGQVIEVVLNFISTIIRNRTRIDLNENPSV